VISSYLKSRAKQEIHIVKKKASVHPNLIGGDMDPFPSTSLRVGIAEKDLNRSPDDGDHPITRFCPGYFRVYSSKIRGKGSAPLLQFRG
jgi:hypothetical protein